MIMIVVVVIFMMCVLDEVWFVDLVWMYEIWFDFTFDRLDDFG